MATRPLPEAAESRYAPYIEELHEFFATSGMPFGSPDDIVLIADRLQEPGSFSEDLGSLIRSMVLREGGAMPHAQLLEILSLAIAGPELAHAPQQYQDPLRQLLKFVSGVMRRPWNVPSSETAEVVSFPTADPSTRTPTPTSEPETFAPRVAVFEKMRGEQIRERYAEPSSRTVVMPVPERLDTVARESTHPAASRIGASQRRLTPLQRYFLLGAGGIMALAAILTFLLRPTPPAEVFQVGPVPTQVATPSHTAVKSRTSGQAAQSAQTEQAVASSAEPVSAASPVVSGPVQEAVPAKPSAYGQAAYPQLNRRSKPAVSAWSSSPTAPAPSQTASQPAANSQAATGAYSPYSPGTPTTAYPSPAGPDASEAPTAPIVRHPAYRDPDASIVGDAPTGHSYSPSNPSRYFTVSSGVMASYLISSPDPEYPTLARLAHIQGQVIMQAVVAKDGSVSAVRVLRGNRLLRGAAQEAVRRWRYRPYRFGGRAIDVATIVTVDFHDRR
ncbi:MAG: TonB family protein [Acidobacteriota bacterium]|nr:TonB family protein [Acidobacteriota bacterium]